MPSVNYYALHLSRLEHAFDEQVMSGSLKPFSQAIARIIAVIERAQAENDDVYQDFFLDTDLDLIETHLGCALITAQVFLTAVVSRVKALHDYHRSQSAHPLTTTTRVKRDILAFGSALVGSSRFTQTQVIDAFANYFKHRDEWRGPWSKLSGQSADTAAVITAVGAQEGSTGNLRTGAAVLGNASYAAVDSYGALILAWKDAIYTGYRTELRSRALVH